jgi:hypothetical protein
MMYKIREVLEFNMTVRERICIGKLSHTFPFYAGLVPHLRIPMEGTYPVISQQLKLNYLRF